MINAAFTVNGCFRCGWSASRSTVACRHPEIAGVIPLSGPEQPFVTRQSYRARLWRD